MPSYEDLTSGDWVVIYADFSKYDGYDGDTLIINARHVNYRIGLYEKLDYDKHYVIVAECISYRKCFLFNIQIIDATTKKLVGEASYFHQIMICEDELLYKLITTFDHGTYVFTILNIKNKIN